MKYSEIRLGRLMASGRFPKVEVTQVSVPNVQVSNEEWNDLVKVAKEEAGDVDAIRRDLLPLLFTNDLVFENDYVKTDYANIAIKRLYLNVKPASGHRFVLNYLCKYDSLVEVQIYDYDEENETSTVLVNSRYAMDQKVALEYNGVNYGYIYVKSLAVHTISNDGEGLARLPYMTDACFTEIGGWEDMKERMTDMETQSAQQGTALATERTRAMGAEAALSERLTKAEKAIRNVLFGSELAETSDGELLRKVQSCIRYLYLFAAPPTGRRYVLNYMAMSPDEQYMGINICTVETDDTTSESAQTYADTVNYEMDKKVPIYNNDTDKVVLGYIYISSEGYIGAVSNNGEGAWRMPYLTDICLNEDQGTKWLEVKLGKTNAAVKANEDAIDELVNGQNVTNARINTLSSRTDSRIESAQVRMNRLESMSNANAQKITTVQGTVSANKAAADAKMAQMERTMRGTQADIEELQEKVDAQGGKFYGYYGTSSALPTGSAVGYAYVGAASPYSIWNFNGSAWADSGAKKADSGADEEDLTVGSDGKMRLKNRTGANGKKYIILRADESFASQIEGMEDAILEIRYDFDLDDETVTIPAGCVLKFEGGSLGNFAALVGTDTAIEAADVQIFDMDCSTQYIDGTWMVEAWKSGWFGAVADGSVTNNETTFATTFAGTDNWNALQGMLNAAYKTNVKEARVLAGFYRVSKPLNAGWPGQYNTIRVKGASTYADFNMGHYKGQYVTMLLIDHWQYGISVNGSHGSVIEDIGLMGRNYQWAVSHSMTQSLNYNTLNYLEVDTYLGSAMKNNAPDRGLSRFAPYAGIVTDALGWDSTVDEAENKEAYNCADYDPETITRYSVEASPFWDEESEVSQSSRTVLKNCSVQGFGVGVCLAPNNRWGNNEFTIIEDCKIIDDVICLAQGNRDARHTAVNNTLLNGGFVGVDTVRFGCQKGTFMGLFQNCNFDCLGNMFEVYRTDDMKLLNSYAENTIRMGRVDDDYQRNTPMVVYASMLFFKAVVNDATPVPDYIVKGDNIVFDCSLLWGFRNLFTVAFAGEEGEGAKNIVLRDCRLYNTQVDADLTPLVFTSSRPFSYGYELVKSNQLDGLPDCSATARNVFVYRTKNHAGCIGKKVLRTQGWTVSHSISAAGVVTIGLTGTFFSHTGAVAVGDLVTNNKTAIVLVVTSVNGQTVTCRPVSGYKKVNGNYVLTDDYYGDFFTFWNVRQVPLATPAVVTDVDGSTLTLSHFDSTLMAVGNAVDWDSYDDGIVMSADWESVITAVDATNKTITLSRAPIYALGQKVKGVIVNDDSAYDMLNLTD